MKAKLKVGRLEFEVENADVKVFVEELAEIEEVFGATNCGACESDNIAFRVRTVGDDKFYENHCLSCGAAKAFGIKKKSGKLFPKRKDKEGNYLPNNGWTKWNKVRDDADEETTETPPALTPAKSTKPVKKAAKKDDEEAPF